VHVHANQVNTNAQFDALCAAARAEANREAARTRKKLSEFASRLAATLDSGEGSVRRLGPHEESEEQARHQSQQNQDSRRKQKERANTETAHNTVSDWA
jgi:hypothetical protein